MDFTCIEIDDKSLIKNKNNITIDYLKQELFKLGENFKQHIILPNNKDDIISCLNKISSNIIFLIASDDCFINYNIKETLCTFFNDKLVNNSEFFKSLTSYYNDLQLPVGIDGEKEYFAPDNCTPMPNINSNMQSFIYDYNGQIFIYLPSNINNAKYVFNLYLIKLFEKLLNKKNIQLIKCFGISYSNIKKLIQTIIENNSKINFVINEINLDATIQVKYPIDIDNDIISNVMRDLYQNLRKYIYTDENISIYECVLDLLKLSKQNIAIFENITSGNIFKELSICPNFKDNLIVDDYISYNVNSIYNKIGGNRQIVEEFGNMSIENVYEICANILKSSNSNISLVVYGDSKNNFENLCFIAIGDVDGIHIYKNKYKKAEDYNEILSKTAIFYLIKKLKQNDLLFEQTTI